jgi:beta-phosphoglucomutase
VNGNGLDPGIALIFDMDGVIVDSEPYHRRAWELFNSRYGLATTEEMHRRVYGKRNDEIVRDFFGCALSDEEVLARGAAKEALYRELIGESLEEALLPGLKQFLRRYPGTPKAVASNAEAANVEFVLKGAGIYSFFRVFVDGYQVRQPKPHPEVYRKAAERLGVNSANCVVFEDSNSGIEAATLAGMRIVGVRTAHFRLPKASLEIDNFSDGTLQPWLLAQKSV